MRFRCLLAAFVLLPLGVPASAEESLTQLVASDDAKFGIRVPQRWTVQRRLNALDRRQVIGFRCSVEGIQKTFDVRVFHLTGVELSPLAQAHVDGKIHAKKSPETSVHKEPVPHLLVPHEKGGRKLLGVYAYARRKGRGLHVHLVAGPELALAVKDAYLTSIDSLLCALDRWPAPPEGYTLHEVKGDHYYLHSQVKPRDLKTIQRVVMDTRKRFEAFHGAVTRPADEPAVFVVFPDEAAALAYDAYAENARYAIWSRPRERRVHTVVVRKADRRVAARLAGEVAEVLLQERYPSPIALWWSRGEAFVAYNAERTGKKGGVVTRGWKDKMKGLTHTLADVEKLRSKKIAEYGEHGRYYVTLMRHGPSKYRKAYRAFLDEVSASGDLDAALAGMWKAVDPAEMLSDAEQYMARKVKVVE